MFGASLVYAIGGILDQLIDDAEKQLVKSRECIVWYREEAKEYEQKLNNLRKLKELQQQQITAAAESSNDSGENLAE
jgi:phage shock protein A